MNLIAQIHYNISNKSPNGFDDSCNELNFSFLEHVLKSSLSQWLDAVQTLLLPGRKHHQDLAPGPNVLQRTGRRTGEDQQLRRKRVRTAVSQKTSAITESSLDRTQVEPEIQRFHLV